MSKDASKKQVAEYNLHRNKWAIISLVLFVATAASALLFGVVDSAIALAVMAALSCACIACALQINDSSKTEELVVVENPYPLDLGPTRRNLRDDEGIFNADGLVAKDTSECFVMSFLLNQMFCRFPVKAKVSKEDYLLPESVLPYIPYLKDYRDKTLTELISLRPDKRVSGLSGDLCLDAFDGKEPAVDVDIVTRYAVQVTDDAFDKLIVNKKKIHDKIVFDGRSLALDDEGALLPLSESGMCNEIDLHCLIVSSDGYAMMARATKDHPLFPGKLVPSASCSLLPDEIESRPIQESMVKSIQSKIRTSYYIPSSKEMKTSFCGLSRMISRGGAPEFYCITCVDMSHDEIIASLRDETLSFDGKELLIEEGQMSYDGLDQVVPRFVKEIRDMSNGDMSLCSSALLMAFESAAEDPDTRKKMCERLERAPRPR